MSQKQLFRILRILAVLFCLALPGITQAQGGDELSETYVSKDGAFSLRYPQDWVVNEDAAGYIFLSDDPDAFENNDLDVDNLFVFITPVAVEAVEANGNSARQTLENFAELSGLELVGSTTRREVDGRGHASAHYSGEGVTGIIQAIEFSEDSFGIVMLATVNDPDEFEAMLSAMTASFTAVEGNAEPCTVSTNEERSVTVRVGPGTNRGSITFLPAGIEFTVLGEAEAEDGSKWWKLDKAEVAPHKSANEMWVAQEQVTSSGSCDNVSEASAPPIIAFTTTSSSGGSAAPFNAGGGQGIFIDFPEWQNQLPADTRASSASAAKLVVLVTPQLTTVENATYVKTNTGERITVQRNRVDYAVSVLDAATGAQVAFQVFTGTEPPPYQSFLAINTTLNGEPPSFSDVLPWLQRLLKDGS
jgi:hypothetical protein